MIKKLILPLLFITISCNEDDSIPNEGSQTQKETSLSDTSFMDDDIYGLFLQLDRIELATYNSSLNIWNEYIAPNFFKKAAESNVGWITLSMGHSKGLYCAPNSIYDNFTEQPLATSSIDIPQLIIDNTKDNGTKLLFRFGIDGPSLTEDWGKNMGWDYEFDQHKHGGTGDFFLKGGTTDTFVENICKVIQFWSERYGEDLDGWWFDHAYERLGWNNSHFKKIRSAARSGNKNSIVTFNNSPGIYEYSDSSDYTAGEIDNILDDYADPYLNPVEDLRYHTIFYLGTGFWGSTDTRYSNFELISYIEKLVKVDGGVTINVNENLGNPEISGQDLQIESLGYAFKHISPINKGEFLIKNSVTNNILSVNQENALVYSDKFTDTNTYNKFNFCLLYTSDAADD